MRWLKLSGSCYATLSVVEGSTMHHVSVAYWRALLLSATTYALTNRVIDQYKFGSNRNSRSSPSTPISSSLLDFRIDWTSHRLRIHVNEIWAYNRMGMIEVSGKNNRKPCLVAARNQIKSESGLYDIRSTKVSRNPHTVHHECFALRFLSTSTVLSYLRVCFHPARSLFDNGRRARVSAVAHRDTASAVSYRAI